MEKVALKVWAEEWLRYKQNYVKESTYANYLILFRNHILPALGERYLEELSTRVIQKKVSFWLSEGRLDGKGGLSQKTVRDIVCVLKKCLQDYSIFYNCETPSIHVEYPSTKKKCRKEILTKRQQESLLARIRNNLDCETVGYALSLYTGIRIGELCALQWKDIDMEERMIIVNKTLQRIYIKDTEQDAGHTKIVITAPKSERAVRMIPISDSLYDLLKKVYCKNKNVYLLTGTKHYIEPRLYRKHYERFQQENMEDYICFHGLRHTFATRCIEAGADYKVVSELLGHASVNLTLNYYVHPQLEDKRRCVECI